MSSPEEPRGPHDDRHLTVIVVPHGDLESRSFSISYAKLKVLVIAGVVLLVVMGLSLAALFPVMTQAARVTALERELKDLEAERARVAELARTLQDVEAQYERIRQLLGADAPVGGNAPVLPPLRDTTRTPAPEEEPTTTALIDPRPLQVPGFITRALADGRSEHPGLDIAVPGNSCIRAAGPGTVRAVGIDGVHGRYIVPDHGEQLQTACGHASALLVTAGDRLRRGQVIALSGSTGRSTAPPLHSEVRRDGRPVDPFTFVKQS